MAKDDLFPSESDIGGRDVDDAEQLAYSFAREVKTAWPVNEVPAGVAADVKALIKAGEAFSVQAKAAVAKANLEYKKPAVEAVSLGQCTGSCGCMGDDPDCPVHGSR